MKLWTLKEWVILRPIPTGTVASFLWTPNMNIHFLPLQEILAHTLMCMVFKVHKQCCVEHIDIQVMTLALQWHWQPTDCHILLPVCATCKGWCPTIKKLADLGFLDVTEQDLTGKTYADLVLQRLNHNEKATIRQKVQTPSWGCNGKYNLISQHGTKSFRLVKFCLFLVKSRLFWTIWNGLVYSVTNKWPLELRRF
jgi:hypothetical protein